MRRFESLLVDFFSEAQGVCGSEGLFQSIFYHHARTYYATHEIKREVKAEGGKVDFVLNDQGHSILIELKAGANGHRNSLAKMKEVEGKGKGLQHDIEKLVSIGTNNDRTSESWLICVDLIGLGIAFTEDDLRKYSATASSQGVSMAYLSQLEKKILVWSHGGKSSKNVSDVGSRPKSDAWSVIKCDKTWEEYFGETRLHAGAECSHVGIFYHALRRAGLGYKQIASEAFFNCNRHGVRSYHIPDFVVYEESFTGCFQLYGNNKRTIENDQHKLPLLVSLLEFKGGASFAAKPIGQRIQDIADDLNKLASGIKPRVEASPLYASRRPGMAQPIFSMVITDIDSRLTKPIASFKNDYKNVIDIRWAGD